MTLAPAQRSPQLWSNGLSPALRTAAVSATCQSSYQFCREMEEVAQRVAAIVLIERWTLPGPGPIEDLRTNARFVRITNAGLRESHVHDVTITREAPNYPTR